jgi:hypothetical protein
MTLLGRTTVATIRECAKSIQPRRDVILQSSHAMAAEERSAFCCTQNLNVSSTFCENHPSCDHHKAVFGLHLRGWKNVMFVPDSIEHVHEWDRQDHSPDIAYNSSFSVPQRLSLTGKDEIIGCQSPRQLDRLGIGGFPRLWYWDAYRPRPFFH